MSVIKRITQNEQAYGAFDNNRILERKPVGFPHESGGVSSFSTLFYWAHAWSEQGGEIGLHPHQGFEILSFVLEGDIEHYDTHLKAWKSLHKGDVQIIRSGKGIQHAEKLLPNSSIFQIWLDPGLDTSLRKKASYNDYASVDFPWNREKEVDTKILVGDGSPLELDSEVEIKHHYLKNNSQTDESISWEVDADYVYGFFVLSGSVSWEVDGEQNVADARDFIQVEGTIKSPFLLIRQIGNEEVQLFEVKVPKTPSYPLYINMRRG